MIKDVNVSFSPSKRNLSQSRISQCGLPMTGTEATIQKLIDKYTKQLYELQVSKLQEQRYVRNG